MRILHERGLGFRGWSGTAYEVGSRSKSVNPMILHE